MRLPVRHIFVAARQRAREAPGVGHRGVGAFPIDREGVLPQFGWRRPLRNHSDSFRKF
jgi:hypothetical protein